MAVYRSDQAQLTFAAEAAPGGAIELNAEAGGATVTSGGHTSHLKANAPAGQRYLKLSDVVGADVGDFIKIGPGTAATAFAPSTNGEVRRIELVEGTDTLWLDMPLGFFHKGSAVATFDAALHDIVVEVEAVGSTAANQVITQIPGIYETVDTPDPEMAIEPRYFLGTQSKRNFFSTLKGQQTYTGSVSGIIPLNASPFRFPIGSMVDVPTTAAAYGTQAITLNGAAKKGDVWVSFKTTTATQAVTANEIVYFGSAVTSPPVAGTERETAVIAATPAAIDVNGIAVRLKTPLRYDHANATPVLLVVASAAAPITHHIFEQIQLDSVSWHVHMRDSSEAAANDFDRRYYGGKIGATTITAEEGGMLTMGWDGVNFLGMVHNQKLGSYFDDATGSADVDIPFYSLMQSIDADTIASAGTFPTNDPFFFSQGQVKIFGETIATIRNFSLSISNNEEPRYYISRQLGRHRGPSEILEQRREYGLAVTLALPESGAANTARKTLWSELLLEGDYGQGMRGFNIELRFDRGTGDNLIIRIPDDYSGASTAAGNFTGAQTSGNQQGAFIRTAAHSITTDNPFQVEADVFFRNMKLEIQDAKGDYV